VDPSLQTVYTYDAFGRLTDTETIADDSSPQVLWNTSVDYDVVNYTGPFRGVEQTTTDEEDDVTDHISDVHGNLAKVIEYDGSTPINTSYGYDGAGRLTSVTNSGDTTTIGYDYGGRKTSLTDPDMGSWSYTYDVFGNLATQADGRNKKLAFAYDDHDRLTRKHRTTTSGYKLAEWFYDATNQVGLLDRSVAYEDPNGDGTVDYTVTVDPQGYDARNRVTSTTWTIDGSSYTVDWTYDPADRMETITYPTVGGDEEIVKYVYDDTNRGLPSGSTSDKPTSNTPLVSAVSWNERGAPLAQTWGSGSNAVARVWEYQTDTLRLNKLEAGTGASTTNRQNLAFSYFDDGNVQWIKDYGNSSQRQCFEYDDLSRLTDAYTIDAGCTGIADWSNSVGVGPYRRQYRYEDNGNIDEVSTAGGSWDDYSYGAGSAGPHAVTSYLGWSYTYDANGNMETRTKSGVSDDDLSFDWNNRLGKYVADDGTATATWLVYDADGTRVARIVDGGDATHYVGGIFEITNPAGSSTSRSYYSFNGQTVGYRYRTSIVDERRFLLSDHPGTNATEVNEASGAVTAGCSRVCASWAACSSSCSRPGDRSATITLPSRWRWNI